MFENVKSVFIAEPWIFPIFAGFVGSCIASFIGLCVSRFPHQWGWRETPIPNLTIVSPASHCDECGEPIRIHHLIPVLGWILARGRCPSCGASIPAIYPVSEAFLALASAAVAYVFGWSETAFYSFVLLWTMFFLAWMDIRETWIPEAVSISLFWMGLLLSPFEADIAARAWGAFAGFTLVYGAMVLTGILKDDDVYAGGDVVLAATLGAWFGTDRIIDVMLLTVLGYLLYAIPRRYFGNGDVMQPMGPAFFLSAVALMFGVTTPILAMVGVSLPVLDLFRDFG